VAPALAGSNSSTRIAAAAETSRFNWNTPSGWAVSRAQPARGGP
jgi:hypothetical protein